jgi:MFS family permease
MLLNGSWMFLVVIPVVVPFYKSHGLSMQEIYWLQSIFALATVVLELPTGYAADLLGRKNSLVVASLFAGCGFTTLAQVSSFEGFVVFELLMSVSVAFFSGSDVALIYESLERLPHPPEAAMRALGRRVFFAQMGETLASLLGGALVVISLQLPAQVNALTGWMPLLVALSLYEPPSRRMSRTRHRDNLAHVARSLFARGPLLRLVLLNLVVYSTATLIAVWAFQAYWHEIGVPLGRFGVLWALYNLVVALTARFAHRIEGTLGFRSVTLTIGVLPVVGYLLMGTSGGWLGVGAGITFQVCRGLSQVVLRDALNTRVPAEMRATANSVAALGMRLVFAFVGPVVGFGMDSVGIAKTLRVLAGVFALALPLVCLPLMRAWRSELRAPT